MATIPVPETPESGVTDAELMAIVKLAAKNLEWAQDELRKARIERRVDPAADSETQMRAAVAQAHSAQAQSLVLYALILAGLDDH